jgi:surface antigen
MTVHHFAKVARTWLLLALGCLLILSCQTAPSREDTGTGLGAILGALLGTQIGSGSGRTVAIIGGAVLGGIVGRTIGRRMDERDREMVAKALETGEPTSWHNEDTGYDYVLTPTGSHVSAEGHLCRDFVQEVIVDGRLETIEGTACRRAAGDTWEEV